MRIIFKNKDGKFPNFREIAKSEFKGEPITAAVFIKKTKGSLEISIQWFDRKYINKFVDNSPRINAGDSPTYTPRGFRVRSSCFAMATNVSTPQADTECPSANKKYSSLRYKKQEKFAPYIPIAKARGFTALSGKEKIIESIKKRIRDQGYDLLLEDGQESVLMV